MNEKNEINDRPCVVVYLDNYLRQVDQNEAELVRVVFTDEEGGCLFLFNRCRHLGSVPL
jgi:hypothetical protein